MSNETLIHSFTKRRSRLAQFARRLLGNDDTNHPFVFIKDMRCAPSGRKQQLTIIYMLGECTTADIKRTFKK